MSRVCDPAVNEENARRCARERPDKLYGALPARVLEVDQVTGEVVLGVTDPIDGEKRCVMQWQVDMWEECPSTLPSEKDKLPAVGADGSLYFERAAVDRFHLHVRVKWPRGAGTMTSYAPLRVWPSQLIFRGWELADQASLWAEIDLANPIYADPSKPVTFNGGEMVVWLSQAGFAEFPVSFPDQVELKAAVALIEQQKATSIAEIARAWKVVALWESVLAHRPDDAAEERELVARLRPRP